MPDLQGLMRLGWGVPVGGWGGGGGGGIGSGGIYGTSMPVPVGILEGSLIKRLTKKPSLAELPEYRSCCLEAQNDAGGHAKHDKNAQEDAEVDP